MRKLFEEMGRDILYESDDRNAKTAAESRVHNLLPSFSHGSWDRFRTPDAHCRPALSKWRQNFGACSNRKNQKDPGHNRCSRRMNHPPHKPVRRKTVPPNSR